MLFHPQKDLFHNDAHQAIRALFIEKRKRLEMTAEALATKMKCKTSFINEIESGSGPIAFSDIELFCDSLAISLTEMESIFKPNSFFR
jgi:ribosome-binding protein aMBF1 (putative translation factor)